MKIKLSDKFNYGRLIRFTLPSIAMMIFTSIYGMVDGYFVSNFAGKTPFAAVNLIYPVVMVLGSIGFMFGAGGSALVSKTLGKGDKERANAQFSLVIYLAFILGLILAVLGIIFMRPLAILLGAEGGMIDDCVSYASIILVALPFFVIHFEFESFFSVAEKPLYGFLVTIISGVTNVGLDALFIIVFNWGIVGAAIATAISQILGGLIPVIYFFFTKSALIKLGKARFDFRDLFKVITNGSSELLSNVSMSVVGMLYNIQLIKYAGENGVAAYGVLMYVTFIFAATFIGYSIGVAPIIGYNFGADDRKELKSVYKKSLVIICVISILMVVMSLLLSKPFSLLYVGYDKELLDLTIKGFTIFSFSFLFQGIAIFGSSFFTALNNGLVSAIISFLRTLVFQILAVILLPLAMGTDGIWYSIIIAELAAAVLTLLFMLANKKKYGY